MTPAEVLTRAGFAVRGSRANCAFCEGNARLTVAIKDYLFYCHRCHKGGDIRRLAGDQGVELPPIRKRRADIPKQRFRDWLAAKRTEMMRLERELTKRWRYALLALSFYPEMPEAWQALADYYGAQERISFFWQSCSDKIGRYWLYRAWRRHNAS